MIFIDSDIIIDYFRGDESIVNILNENLDKIATTEINVFEVMFGFHLKKNISEKRINEAIKFFDSIDVFAFDYGCGEKSAELLSILIKEGKQIDQNDCLIASIILKNGFNKILTNNKKHFERIKGLKLV